VTTTATALDFTEPDATLIGGTASTPTVAMTNYARLLGRSGGQTIKGGTANSETLTLRGTNGATAGTIKIPDNTRIGDSTTPTHALEVTTAAVTSPAKKSGTLIVNVTTPSAITAVQDSLIDLNQDAILTIGTGGGLSSMLNTDNGLYHIVGNPAGTGWL